MPRPRIAKNICDLPKYTDFKPTIIDNDEVVAMTAEEYEVIRLIDQQGLQQEECATHMGVSRPTVQLLYTSARSKLADFIVNGKTLKIVGGDYKVCEQKNGKCLKGHCTKCDNE